jgi:hypothetical protein
MQLFLDSLLCEIYFLRVAPSLEGRGGEVGRGGGEGRGGEGGGGEGGERVGEGRGC